MTRIEAMQAKEIIVAVRVMLYDVYEGRTSLTPDIFRGILVELEMLMKIIKRFE